MPIELSLRLPPRPEPHHERDRELLATEAARQLGIARGRIALARLDKVSFDARRRHRNWLLRLTVFETGEELPAGPTLSPPELEAPGPEAPHAVVVGSGPAGLFCALDLIAAGIRVTLLERGGNVRERRRPLAELNRGNGVDPESNYCFGEGGAGTYSDGKLYARSGSKRAIRGVLETLVAHGARPEILSSWRPHIGSNKLPEVVANLRRSLIAGGAEVRFHARVEELLVEGSRVVGVEWRDLTRTGGACQRVSSDAVVLATGHSARDSLELAARAGALLEPKGFAIGVRIEHPQAWVDEQQYGGLRTQHELPAAFYELVEQVEGRGVYSFCMCPGGWIVPATTAGERVVVNGMSLSRRDSPFANSGLVVQLEPEDWCGARAEDWGLAELVGGAPRTPDEDPLFGTRIQEALERRCRAAGGGRLRVPAQRADRFAAGGGDALRPTSYRPGTSAAELGALLPRGVAERLRGGLEAFERRLPGFASELGLMLAPESRTSSPVRLGRDRVELEALAAGGGRLEGLCPAGEGAGFAGGIVSAALDGRRVAARLASRLLDRP